MRLGVRARVTDKARVQIELRFSSCCFHFKQAVFQFHGFVAVRAVCLMFLQLDHGCNIAVAVVWQIAAPRASNPNPRYPPDL